MKIDAARKHLAVADTLAAMLRQQYGAGWSRWSRDQMLAWNVLCQVRASLRRIVDTLAEECNDEDSA